MLYYEYLCINNNSLSNIKIIQMMYTYQQYTNQLLLIIFEKKRLTQKNNRETPP